MTLRHLQIFVTVCRAGSMRAAAEKLYIAQPSVSTAVAELERHYGVRLFDRISRRLYLTQPGHLLLQYAQHITELFERLERELPDADGRGELRIGASITVGNRLLPGYATQFRAICPQVRLRITIANSASIIRMVPENRMDLGLIEGAVYREELRSVPFYHDRLVLICQPQHPFAGREDITPDEVNRQPLLLRETGSGVRELFESAMQAHGLSIAPLWESVSTEALLEGVRAGLGISALPELLVRDALEQGHVALFTVPQLHLTREFRMTIHKNKFLSPSLRALMEICLGEKLPDSLSEQPQSIYT